MVQGIPIGMKVSLVQQMTAQQDIKIFKTKKPSARCCPVCLCLPATTSDPFYIEVAIATAQPWRKKLSLFRKGTEETWTVGIFFLSLFCVIYRDPFFVP